MNHYIINKLGCKCQHASSGVNMAVALTSLIAGWHVSEAIYEVRPSGTFPGNGVERWIAAPGGVPRLSKY